MRTGFLAVWLCLCAPALAQQTTERIPDGTRAAVAALSAGGWDEIEPGLESMDARGEGNLRVLAFRIDGSRFRLEPVIQSRNSGETAREFAQRSDAVLAVNGGFFGEKEQRKTLFPVGYMRIGGDELSANWRSSGGYAVFGERGVDLLPSRSVPPSGSQDVLQSKPMLIEPGGKWAMNSDNGIGRPRTLLCRPGDGDIMLILVVAGSGLSLFEAGWMMRSPEDGGFFACDSALALDGGGSSQLWVRGMPDLGIEGETPVHNALVLKRR